MYSKMTLREYLDGEESVRPIELAYGVVREPPAPTWAHQIVVGRIQTRLGDHVQHYQLGRVVASPIDVVLNTRPPLVIQPDVIFVSNQRLNICRDRVWGAPDLVVEVLSTGTRHHDRTVKVDWYRKYGVRECWLVDPVSLDITVRGLAGRGGESRVFQRDELVRSAVLPRLRLRPRRVFESSGVKRIRRQV
jgi:Uma2 family endonuclease